MATYQSLPPSDTEGRHESSLPTDLQRVFQPLETAINFGSLPDGQVRRKPLSKTDSRSVNSQKDTSKAEVSLLTEDSILPKHARHTQGREHRNVLRQWWTEIAAILLSISALIAIFGLVYPYRVLRPIPDWPSAITINAIISILSVILRAGIVVATAEALSQQKWIWFCKDRKLIDLLRFDQATRGPWGSFKLTFSLSSISLMGSFGAVIMVLAVAVGPFAQQLVHYETCSLPSLKANATAFRQGIYTIWGQHISSIYQRPEFGMQRSINAGLFAPQAIAVPVTCPSRNCTFGEPFSTLGYCSSCTDVTSELNVDRYEYNVTQRYNSTDPDTNITTLISANETITIVNYTLPTGSSLYYNNSDFETPRIALTAQSVSDFGPWVIIYQSLLGSGSCTATEHSDSSWTCRGYGAARCDLTPCVHTYSLHVTDGTVQETLLHTQTKWGLGGGSQYYSMLNVPCLGPKDKETVRNQGYIIDDSTEWLAYNISLERDGYWYTDISNLTAGAPPHCLYQIAYFSITAINYYVKSVLEGNVTTEGSSYTGSPGLQILFNDSYTSFARVESSFKNISMGITSNMRQTGNWTSYGLSKNVSEIFFAPNRPVLATIMEAQTCVAVRWGWLAFPTAMITLAILFLILTMIDSTFDRGSRSSGQAECNQSEESASRAAATWKSSLLPLLFHGLEEKDVKSVGLDRFMSEKEMETAAKSRRTKFAYGLDGWKLAKAD